MQQECLITNIQGGYSGVYTAYTRHVRWCPCSAY